MQDGDVPLVLELPHRLLRLRFCHEITMRA